MVMAACIAGLILGFRYRWPPLFAATIIVVACAAGLGPFSGWTASEIVLMVVVTVTALQFGYLGGLGLATLHARSRSSSRKSEVSRAVKTAHH